MRAAHDESTPLMSDIQRPPGDEPHPDAPLPDPATRLEMADSDDTADSSDPPSKKKPWIPYPVRRLWKSAADWARGPPSPQRYTITPFYPRVQEFPLVATERFLPRRKQRLGLLALLFAVWAVTFALVKRREVYASEIEGWGDPQTIGCGATYWTRGNNCGLNGDDCRPFNGSGFAFRCPADCKSYRLLNPRAVGNQSVNYRPLVIGGPGGPDSEAGAVYRGDSYICGSAIHAGAITNTGGGCGVVTLLGQSEGFVASERNGISSLGFDSYFPLSFTFVDEVNCQAKDMRWPLLAISVVCTSLLSLATASPTLFYFGSFVGIFWTVGVATDTPNHSSIPDLVSTVVGRFLPAMFCAWVMFDKMGVRRTLRGLTAQIEKTVLWLGACWVGALDNYTLSFIPISRLNSHDLAQQPGARGALAGIIILLLIIISTQIYFFRQEGRLTKYLKLYGLFVLSIIVCLVLPDLNFRLHHYILALLLLPATSLQMRPSLLYQGLLVGLFINGIARWGFDPVLQTDLALQGDAQHGSLLPVVLEPEIDLGSNTSSITFRWEDPPDITYDGVSVMVNDVERFRGYYDDEDTKLDTFKWTRQSGLGLDEYFRFGYLAGRQGLDYTKAGVWTADGEWVKMAPGPSSVEEGEGEEENGGGVA
ncbi:related to LCCL domain protein [Cephalotrichum gorgonifer]|uniref:Related to LCCL domain protein n=1 Tax=Cephalotrichum gorgonifer TaxID=2041049 RepID=A0AAE8SSX1_9PEZI|nr:related to LCCL domain protein [Cephalotrichum gorgonifer]